VYGLPFAEGEFDAALLVRAAHHLTDLPAAVAEIARVLKTGGHAVIEIANKRNLLEILRWCFGRSKMRPFALEPASRGADIYNFHPRYAEKIFKQNNLQIKKTLGASNFRLPLLKKIFGVPLLCFKERLAQGLSGRLKLSPSVYYLLEKK
jgi:ubiquinone/menaquinone biosynthesis C-methylase UbiE